MNFASTSVIGMTIFLDNGIGMTMSSGSSMPQCKMTL
jgi:hypothetical protein